MSVNVSQIESAGIPVQSGDSCVLLSYAIAGRYFLRIPVERFFSDYMNCFSISCTSSTPLEELERLYDWHFHPITRYFLPGNQVIYSLHSNGGYSFEIARQSIKAEYFEVSTCIDHIESKLRNEKSMLTVFFNTEGHNAACGHDGSDFFYVETRVETMQNQFSNRIVRFENLEKLNNQKKLGDGILLTS